MRKLNKENGVTLVELLAAIAILSIIVTGFLGFFIQAAKTNQHTNAVNEATFLAQERMEEVIHEAESGVKPEVGIQPKGSYKIETKMEEVLDTNLYKVIVIVSEGDNSRAKMENILEFESEEDKTDNTE